MKEWLLLLGCVILYVNLIKAQGLRSRIAAPGMGGQAYQKDPGIFGFTENIASIVNTPPALAVYAERSYLLNPLQSLSIFGACNAFGGSIGLAIKCYGYSDFQELETGLAYAKTLGPKIAIGTQFNYYNERIPGYFTRGMLRAELGVLYFPTSKFAAGLDVYDLFGKTTDESGGSLIHLGMGYRFNPFFFLSFSILKIENQPAAVMPALHYNLNKSFFLSGGFQTNTCITWLDVGYVLQRFRLDLTVSNHPWLGISNGIALTWTGSKATNKVENETVP